MKTPEAFNNMAFKAIICGLSFTFVSFAGTEIAQAKALNGAEIKTMISGNSFSFTGPASGNIKFTKNGRVGYKLTTGNSASGKWWIKGNQYCTQYPNRKAKCYSVNTGSAGAYKVSGGYTLKPL